MFTARLRPTAVVVALMSLALAAAQACSGAPGSPRAPNTATAPGAPTAAEPQITPMTDISADCAGGSSELE
jgi:hypothetical protein